MCSHYEAPENDRLLAGFGVAPDSQMPIDLWPMYMGPFIRLRDEGSVGDDLPEFEALTGQFGLLPFWAKDRKLGRQTFELPVRNGQYQAVFQIRLEKRPKVHHPRYRFF